MPARRSARFRLRSHLKGVLSLSCALDLIRRASVRRWPVILLMTFFRRHLGPQVHRRFTSRWVPFFISCREDGVASVPTPRITVDRLCFFSTHCTPKMALWGGS